MKGFKEKDYYLKVLENRQEALVNATKQINKINKNDSLEAQSKQLAKNRLTIAVLNYDILHVMYSCEFSKDDLKQQFSTTLHLFISNWNSSVVKMHIGRQQKMLDIYYIDYYIRLRWMLSFAVLLDAPQDGFNSLAMIVKNDNIKDSFYDTVFASRIDNWEISKELLLKKPSNKLNAILFGNDNEKSQNDIKNYLDKDWYKTYKNYGNYQTHNKADENYYFFGYWAFEVAALVKIKGLDDSTFRENQYYPDRLL